MKKNKCIKIFDGLKKTVEELDALAKHGGGLAGIDTGLAELNNLTSGFMGGELIVIAARPAIGKTALALNIVETVSSKFWNNPKNKKSEKPLLNAVAVFSFETRAIDLTKKMLSAHGYIDSQNIKSGELMNKDIQGLSQSVKFFKDKEIFINAPCVNFDDVISECKTLKKDNPSLKLIIIDNLQLIEVMKKRFQNRYEQLSYIVREIKRTALKLNIPIILLSELNRTTEKRKEGISSFIPDKPKLIDLRDTGSIEDIADKIIFIHRPSAYSDDPQYAGKVQLLLLKQRNGPVGEVEVSFTPKYSRFDDMQRKILN